MINRTGLSGAVNNSNPSKVSNKAINPSSNYGGDSFIGRVEDIILDETHPKFKENGEWNGVGTIYFSKVNPTLDGNIKAKPFFPQFKNTPLKNELVLILTLPDTEMGVSANSKSFYYLNNINLWNHPHHNAYPSPIKNTLPPSQQKDYIQTQSGSVRRVTDESTEIDLNSNSTPSISKFIERSNIHPLMSFNGDLIHEGRFGNSLRFGGTLKSDSILKNPWSEVGTNGDPITILRNGQPQDTTDEGWIPINEDVNKDLSSIYLTSTQKLPLNYNDRFNLFSRPNRFIPLNQYQKPQLLLLSNRVVINSKEDDILLGAGSNISLFASNYCNISSNNLYIDPKNVKLGSKSATEPLLLGNKTINLFSQLLSALNNLVTVLESDQIYPGGAAAPNTPMNLVASNTKNIITQIQSQLESTKSKISKTI